MILQTAKSLLANEKTRLAIIGRADWRNPDKKRDDLIFIHLHRADAEALGLLPNYPITLNIRADSVDIHAHRDDDEDSPITMSDSFEDCVDMAKCYPKSTALDLLEKALDRDIAAAAFVAEFAEIINAS